MQFSKISAHILKVFWSCSPKLIGIGTTFGEVGAAEVKEVRTKTANGYLGHFGDKESGKSTLDEVAKDTIEVKGEPRQGNWAFDFDLRVSEELHRYDDKWKNYDPDDKSCCCRKLLRIYVGVQEGLVITKEPPLVGLLLVDNKTGSTKGEDGDELKACFCEDLLLGRWSHGRTGSGSETD